MNPDLSAEFRLSSPSLPLVDLAAAVPDARIEVDEVLLADRVVFLCWIEAEYPESVEAALDAEASIHAWSLLETAADRRLYRLRTVDTAEVRMPIEAAFVERGATPKDATVTAEGWLVRARFPDRTTLAAYREDCHRRGMEFVLEGLYEPTDGESPTLAGLTPKQREALLLAHDAGYYDVPRETTLADLSDRLGIARRSLSARLRRAERQLVETAVTNDRNRSRR